VSYQQSAGQDNYDHECRNLATGIPGLLTHGEQYNCQYNHHNKTNKKND
jgi:hypothetical protein